MCRQAIVEFEAANTYIIIIIIIIINWTTVFANYKKQFYQNLNVLNRTL